MSLFHCDFLKDLIGSFVRVNRGGPESQKGTIVAVCSDYFVLKNEKGELYYYQIRHLKSITKNAKDCKADDWNVNVKMTLKSYFKASNIAG